MRFGSDNSSFNFLHNPRTGGRHVTEILLNNGYQCYDSPFVNSLFIDDNAFTEIIHLNYNQTQIIFEEMRKFTVVRDPVQRFMSALQVSSISARELDDYDRFLWYMEECEFNFRVRVHGLTNIPNRWFRSQHEWCGPDVSVWVFENGFNDNFAEWLNVELNIGKLKTKNKPTPAIHSVSNKLRANIERYYEKDMELYETYNSKSIEA